MPTREQDVANLLLADATMVALLIGGIYTEEQIGVEGIRRGEGSPTEVAFDAEGYLLPSAVIREGDEVPYGELVSLTTKFAAQSQMLYIFFYQNRGSEQIRLAKARSYQVLQGAKLSVGYPIWWEYDSSPVPDAGPVKNSTVIRQDWQCISTRRADS